MKNKVILPAVHLEFSEGTSDKEYNACIDEASGGYVVNFSYGRRGGTLTFGTKTPTPVDLDAAVEIYTKLVDSKTKKGYA